MNELHTYRSEGRVLSPEDRLSVEDITALILDLEAGKEEATRCLASTHESRNKVAPFSASFKLYSEMINTAREVIAKYRREIRQWQSHLDAMKELDAVAMLVRHESSERILMQSMAQNIDKVLAEVAKDSLDRLRGDWNGRRKWV